SHYRTQLNFTFEGLDAAAKSLERIGDFLARLRSVTNPKACGFVAPILERTFKQFSEALADDLNISPALAALFEMIRELNSLYDAQKIGTEEAQASLELLQKL